MSSCTRKQQHHQCLDGEPEHHGGQALDGEEHGSKRSAETKHDRVADVRLGKARRLKLPPPRERSGRVGSGLAEYKVLVLKLSYTGLGPLSD